MDTDLKLYYMKLRRENQLHRHSDAHLQRERAVRSMRASTAYKNLEIQRGSLQESSRRLPVGMQRYYMNLMQSMGDRMGGIEAQYPELSRKEL
jgi:hypothetical protein